MADADIGVSRSEKEDRQCEQRLLLDLEAARVGEHLDRLERTERATASSAALV